uniref:Uncharacterized protein n=1 Tax=Chromera velia CCMP2878 TaxID=1169474 RepID=A0A0G4GJ23_9ALVE|eukprot:Cvel_4783.t1-p1 / transcript=Cvel_4783.t1 / gene=Cvel_4783 / organism=Chromera_velia_CCMP2878 / gene_product=hypothetical protein / transcript_product=hypothetical protein / location=Cvel_scaffold213:112775-113614(+) / protein_length=280 / sequence_SO=supercontig / SO=protein_coding / is_pseudo=false
MGAFSLHPHRKYRYKRGRGAALPQKSPDSFGSEASETSINIGRGREKVLPAPSSSLSSPVQVKTPSDDDHVPAASSSSAALFSRGKERGAKMALTQRKPGCDSHCVGEEVDVKRGTADSGGTLEGGPRDVLPDHLRLGLSEGSQQEGQRKRPKGYVNNSPAMGKSSRWRRSSPEPHTLIEEVVARRQEEEETARVPFSSKSQSVLVKEGSTGKAGDTAVEETSDSSAESPTDSSFFPPSPAAKDPPVRIDRSRLPGNWGALLAEAALVNPGGGKVSLCKK